MNRNTGSAVHHLWYLASMVVLVGCDSPEDGKVAQLEARLMALEESHRLVEAQLKALSDPSGSQPSLDLSQGITLKSGEKKTVILPGRIELWGANRLIFLLTDSNGPALAIRPSKPNTHHPSFTIQHNPQDAMIGFTVKGHPFFMYLPDPETGELIRLTEEIARDRYGLTPAR